MKIGIINCGIGNIHSVKKAFSSLGAKVYVIQKPTQLKIVDKIVLPGVGAFGEAVKKLERQNLIFALKKESKCKPILGICLGMQLFFERSQESPSSEGLKLIKGEVLRFKKINKIKIPHIGWNQIKIIKENHILKEIPDGSYFYFCHSYYVKPEDKSIILANCNYGVDFSCVIRKENLYGVQFHPEKSQKLGLKLIKNFLQRC